jgi:hypothetical protein
MAKDSLTLNGQLEACADRSSVSTASHFLVSEKLPNCQGMGGGGAWSGLTKIVPNQI